MPKRLMLVVEEGPVDQLDKAKDMVNGTLKTGLPDLIFKVMDYQPDYPEEVTYHVGQTMKFISNGKFQPNGSGVSDMEDADLSPEQLTFRQQVAQFWNQAKPVLKQLAKETWYSKKDLQRIAEGKKPESRISSGTVRFAVKEENLGKKDVQTGS